MGDMHESIVISARSTAVSKNIETRLSASRVSAVAVFSSYVRHVMHFFSGSLRHRAAVCGMPARYGSHALITEHKSRAESRQSTLDSGLKTCWLAVDHRATLPPYGYGEGRRTRSPR